MYEIRHLDHSETINAAILEQFSQCREAPDHQSHFFHGRFENLYIDRQRIPALAAVLEAAREYAADILQRDSNALKTGFWFNLMAPGHVTTLHSHDEDDELLSCVYYIEVPEHSGDLLLHLPEGEQRIEPVAGRFVFFSPDLEHAVAENRSGQSRLSVAINFGPADSE